MTAAPKSTESPEPNPVEIGPYRILDLLGEGGMGVVFRAAPTAGGDAVALKTVRVAKGDSVASIRAEIHALSRLRHPQVVRILGEGVADGIPWYAMELLEGVTLRDHLGVLWGSYGELGAHTTTPDVRPGAEGATARDAAAGASAPTQRAADGAPPAAGRPVRVSVRPPAPAAPRRQVAAGRVAEVLTLMRRLCAPLAYLHGRGIIHRDLKPGNVFVRPSGEPVLMDFGLVSRFRGAVGREALEIGGLLVGTAAYMAPEQAMGLLVDARADLYAFGVMLYEALTGTLPFTGHTTRDLLQRHVSEPPEPPSARASGVSGRLDALVLRLLAKRPRDRFGYAEDVAAELAELGADPSPEVRSRTYLYRPELSGREEALGRLEGAIRRLQDGGGGCVLVGGESGVGKTSLVARAARNATLARLTVVTGECVPIAIGGAAKSAAESLASRIGLAGERSGFDVKGAPLHPFQALLEAVADRCREGGRERTDRLLGRRGKVLAAYVPALRELPGQAEQPEPAELPVEAAHQRLLDDLGETLSAFVADVGPVLLVIDDLQWADELSLSFIGALPPDYFERQPLLVFGTYRSDETSALLRELIARHAAGAMLLGRLDEATVGVIVSDMLALPSPPPPFVRYLAQQSEGNPFFVAEYLRAAVEEGLLRREGGAWRIVSDAARDDGSGRRAGASLATPIEELALPSSLRELVARRLMGLGEEARELLEVAAVLGREIDPPLLARAAGTTEAAALLALKELALRQVLLPAEGDRHRFAHDKLREITYGRIAPERRRALHRAAAEALERELASSSRVALRHGELAHHWTAAEVWPKAIHHLEKAGEQALRDFSNREAIRLFGQALAIGEQMQERPGPLSLARWERALMEARFYLGEDAAGIVHAERALAHCRRPVPASRAARVLGFLAQIVIRTFRGLVPARKVTSPAKRALLLEAAYVSQRMLEPAFRDNDPLLGTYCGLRSLNLAEKLPISPPLARGYAFMSMIVGLTPLQGVARAWSDKALRYADEIGSDPLVIYCLSRVACYTMAVARWEDSEAQLRRAGEMARRLGDLRQYDEALALLGTCLHANGRFTEAADVGKEMLASAEARGDVQIQGWARVRIAQSLARLGRATEALAVLDAGRDWVERGAEFAEAFWAEAAEALAQRVAGRPDDARRVAAEALARMTKRPPVQIFVASSCAEVVDVYLSLWEEAAESGRDEVIAEPARSAVAILERVGRMVHFMRPAAIRARASVAWLDGKAATALKGWRRSLAEAERLQMPYEQARAHLEIGLHAEPDEARVHLERAVEHLGRLGAVVDLLHAREALVEVGG